MARTDLWPVAHTTYTPSCFLHPPCTHLVKLPTPTPARALAVCVTLLWAGPLGANTPQTRRRRCLLLPPGVAAGAGWRWAPNRTTHRPRSVLCVRWPDRAQRPCPAVCTAHAHRGRGAAHAPITRHRRPLCSGASYGTGGPAVAPEAPWCGQGVGGGLCPGAAGPHGPGAGCPGPGLAAGGVRPGHPGCRWDMLCGCGCGRHPRGGRVRGGPDGA